MQACLRKGYWADTGAALRTDTATTATRFFRISLSGIRGERAPVRAATGRGLAYWTDGQGDSRILYVTPGYHLIALDARTGRPIFSFGTNGVVDLFLELDHPVPEPGEIGWNSPPIVVRNVVVVGAALQNSSATREFPTGYVRGYNVRTGERAWIFHTIPPYPFRGQASSATTPGRMIPGDTRAIQGHGQ